MTSPSSLDIRFGDQASQRILSGAGRLTRLVELTLGPFARSVLIDGGNAAPMIANSGYDVATHFDVGDVTAQAGVQALRNMAWEQSRDRGDGTATAVSLAGAVLHGMRRLNAAGFDPQRLGEVVLRQGAAIAVRLQGASRTATDVGALTSVATAAVVDCRDLGRLIGEAIGEVGTDGAVLVEAGSGASDEKHVQAGMHFASGLLSPAFATDTAAGTASFDDAYIMVSADRIDSFDDLLPMLEVFAARQKPLIVIAREIVGQALATLVVNRCKAGALVAAIAAPGAGDWKRLYLGDIAAVTGATLMGDECGYRLSAIRPAFVGRARRVEIGRTHSTIIGGAAHAASLESRKAGIRSAIESARYLAFDRTLHEQRLARLSGAVATIRVAGRPGPELQTRLDRARQGAAATRAARSGGVVAGGGASLLHAATAALDDARGEQDRIVAAMLQQALGAPLRAVVRNRGRDGRRVSALVAASRDPAIGYEAEGDRITDLHQASVVDACDVVTDALSSAVSTAVTLASVKVAIGGSAKEQHRGLTA